jgi:phosphocarrier protein HPr
MMVTRRVRVGAPLGLHARAAARFVRAASRFQSAIRVAREGDTAEGKSIISLLRLAAPHGAELTIAAEGPDADAAVDALAQLVESGFETDPWTD